MSQAFFLIGVLLLGFPSSRQILAGQDAARGADLDHHRPTVVHIPPGMMVGKTPPEGWSHLVIKSLPRLGSGDLGDSAAARPRGPPPCSDGDPGRRRLPARPLGLSCAPENRHGLLSRIAEAAMSSSSRVGMRKWASTSA